MWCAGSPVTARLWTSPCRLPSTSGQTPSTTTFSWMVLSALVDEVAASVANGSVTIGMKVVRHVGVDA